MKQIYRVTVCGRILESAEVGKLLARAVAEKRAMERRLQMLRGAAFIEPRARVCEGEAGIGGGCA